MSADKKQKSIAKEMTGAGEKSEGSDDEQEEQEEYTTGGCGGSAA